MLGSSPLHETTVAAAVHAHPTVAPGLLGNPINHRPRIFTVVLIGNDSPGAVGSCVNISHDPHVAVSCALLRVILREHVKRELEEGGQGLDGAARAHQHDGNASSAGARNRQVLRGHVAPMIILDVECTNEGAKVPIGIEGQICPDELDRLRQRNRPFGPPLIERPLQIQLQNRQRCSQTLEERVRVGIVEQQQHILE